MFTVALHIAASLLVTGCSRDGTSKLDAEKVNSNDYSVNTVNKDEVKSPGKLECLAFSAKTDEKSVDQMFGAKLGMTPAEVDLALGCQSPPYRSAESKTGMRTAPADEIQSRTYTIRLPPEEKGVHDEIRADFLGTSEGDRLVKLSRRASYSGGAQPVLADTRRALIDRYGQPNDPSEEGDLTFLRTADGRRLTVRNRLYHACSVGSGAWRTGTNVDTRCGPIISATLREGDPGLLNSFELSIQAPRLTASIAAGAAAKAEQDRNAEVDRQRTAVGAARF